MTYFVLDHLGSVAVITDANGQTLKDSNNVETGRQFFDVWGRMRNADGSPDTTCALPANSASTRGYTNQEQIAAVCLDNYNARLYDPQMGRFLTADPSDGSGLNRYWYVGDNPLSLTDPTGLCFLGCFWKSPTGKAVIDIVLVIVLHEYALPLIEEQLAVTVADVANIAASAGIAGYVTTGRLDSALIQSAEAVAMYGVGQYVDGLEDPAHPVVTNFQGGIIRIGLHGLVGGLASAAGHGGFVSGFLAAGFGAAADTIDTGEMPIDVITHAIAGGVGSALGGGKFADGAETGAFGYLFNKYMSTVPRYMKDFFDNYDMKLIDVEVKLGLCNDCLVGLAAHESTYGSSNGAVNDHNLFGLDCCNGTKIIRFKSVDDSIQYWVNKYGAGVKGDEDMGDFIRDLRKMGYNSKDPSYDQKMRDQIDSVRHYEKMWKDTKQ